MPMDTGRLERIYEEQFIDRDWWGDFPQAENVVQKDFSGVEMSALVAVCAKIALNVTGEIPRIVLSNKAPNLSVNPEKIIIPVKLLRMELPEEIRVNALFGCFVHELGHRIYTRQEVELCGQRSYTLTMNALIHLVEDRRVESKLVKAFPGYHYFLYTARRLMLAVGYLALEQQTGFYGGPGLYGKDEAGEDGSEALMNYICSCILFPNLLEDPSWLRSITAYPGNISKVQAVNRILDPIKRYASLSYKEVEAVAEDLLQVIGSREMHYENFFLKEMKHTLNGIENFETDQQVRLAESVIRDMQKTFNPEEYYVYSSVATSKDVRQQTAEKEFVHTVRETEAEAGEITEALLSRAQEMASGIRLQLSMLSAKLDKHRILYEQDSGEPDEEDLYQSRFNRNVFYEEQPLPAARLDVVILLDLSGSMVTGKKMDMQAVMAAGLSLAFEKYANTVRYSVYGHRCDEEGLQIVCFHRAGTRLRLEKFFGQQALYANADGYAMEYCFRKFGKDSGHRIFFIISDGNPSVAGYEGEDAREHVRHVVDKARRENIEVLSIGIDNFDQADMYDEFIPYSGPETALMLSKWLKKKFRLLADAGNF